MDDNSTATSTTIIAPTAPFVKPRHQDLCSSATTAMVTTKCGWRGEGEGGGLRNSHCNVLLSSGSVAAATAINPRGSSSGSINSSKNSDADNERKKSMVRGEGGGGGGAPSRFPNSIGDGGVRTKLSWKEDETMRGAVYELLGQCETTDTRSYKKWQSMIDRNLEKFMQQHRSTFSRRFRRGVPQAFRWEVWKVMSDVSNHRPSGSSARYLSLAQQPSSYSNLIKIDTPRTFPELKIFDEASQHQLFRVLNAYSNSDTEVGYCQGMNFIAGLLLLVSNFQEEETYWVLMGIMKHYDLQGFFQEKFPLLRRYIKAFDKLSELHIPELRQHFIEEGVMPPVYLHQWFLTLYVTSLPLRTVVVVWDFLLCEGLNGLLPLTVALLNVLQRFLLRLGFEEIVKFLKSLKSSGGCDDVKIGKLLVKQAEKIIVPEDIISSLTNVDMVELLFDAEVEETSEGGAAYREALAKAATTRMSEESGGASSGSKLLFSTLRAQLKGGSSSPSSPSFSKVTHWEDGDEDDEEEENPIVAEAESDTEMFEMCEGPNIPTIEADITMTSKWASRPQQQHRRRKEDKEMSERNEELLNFTAGRKFVSLTSEEKRGGKVSTVNEWKKSSDTSRMKVNSIDENEEDRYDLDEEMKDNFRCLRVASSMTTKNKKENNNEWRQHTTTTVDSSNFSKDGKARKLRLLDSSEPQIQNSGSSLGSRSKSQSKNQSVKDQIPLENDMSTTTRALERWDGNRGYGGVVIYQNEVTTSTNTSTTTTTSGFGGSSSGGEVSPYIEEGGGLGDSSFMQSFAFAAGNSLGRAANWIDGMFDATLLEGGVASSLTSSGSAVASIDMNDIRPRNTSSSLSMTRTSRKSDRRGGEGDITSDDENYHNQNSSSPSPVETTQVLQGDWLPPSPPLPPIIPKCIRKISGNQFIREGAIDEDEDIPKGLLLLTSPEGDRFFCYGEEEGETETKGGGEKGDVQLLEKGDRRRWEERNEDEDIDDDLAGFVERKRTSSSPLPFSSFSDKKKIENKNNNLKSRWREGEIHKDQIVSPDETTTSSSSSSSFVMMENTVLSSNSAPTSTLPRLRSSSSPSMELSSGSDSSAVIVEKEEGGGKGMLRRASACGRSTRRTFSEELELWEKYRRRKEGSPQRRRIFHSNNKMDEEEEKDQTYHPTVVTGEKERKQRQDEKEKREEEDEDRTLFFRDARRKERNDGEDKRDEKSNIGRGGGNDGEKGRRTKARRGKEEEKSLEPRKTMMMSDREKVISRGVKSNNPFLESFARFFSYKFISQSAESEGGLEESRIDGIELNDASHIPRRQGITVEDEEEEDEYDYNEEEEEEEEFVEANYEEKEKTDASVLVSQTSLLPHYSSSSNCNRRNESNSNANTIRSTNMSDSDDYYYSPPPSVPPLFRGREGGVECNMMKRREKENRRKRPEESLRMSCQDDHDDEKQTRMRERRSSSTFASFSSSTITESGGGEEREGMLEEVKVVVNEKRKGDETKRERQKERNQLFSLSYSNNDDLRWEREKMRDQQDKIEAKIVKAEESQHSGRREEKPEEVEEEEEEEEEKDRKKNVQDTDSEGLLLSSAELSASLLSVDKMAAVKSPYRKSFSGNGSGKEASIFFREIEEDFLSNEDDNENEKKREIEGKKETQNERKEEISMYSYGRRRLSSSSLSSRNELSSSFISPSPNSSVSHRLPRQSPSHPLAGNSSMPSSSSSSSSSSSHSSSLRHRYIHNNVFYKKGESEGSSLSRTNILSSSSSSSSSSSYSSSKTLPVAFRTSTTRRSSKLQSIKPSPLCLCSPSSVSSSSSLSSKMVAAAAASSSPKSTGSSGGHSNDVSPDSNFHVYHHTGEFVDIPSSSFLPSSSLDDSNHTEAMMLEFLTHSFDLTRNVFLRSEKREEDTSPSIPLSSTRCSSSVVERRKSIRRGSAFASYPISGGMEKNILPGSSGHGEVKEENGSPFSSKVSSYSSLVRPSSSVFSSSVFDSSEDEEEECSSRMARKNSGRKKNRSRGREEEEEEERRRSR